MADQTDMNHALMRFESFINGTLKEDLKILDNRLGAIEIEIAEYTNIKRSLIMLNAEEFQKNFKTQVDIGHNFFMQAKVKEPNRMLFDIGLNHYLEFTREEAIKYADARIDALMEVATALTEKSAETKAHIKLMLFGIGELQNINMNL